MKAIVMSVLFFFFLKMGFTQEPGLMLPVGHGSAVKMIVLSAKQNMLLTSGDNNAILWDLKTQKQLQIYSSHTDYVYGAKFSPDETKIITWSQDKTVKVWELKTGRLLFTITGFNEYIRKAVFSPEGKHVLVLGNNDNTLKVYNAVNGGLIYNSVNKSTIEDFGITADGKSIFIAGYDGVIRKWINLKEQSRKLTETNYWYKSLVVSKNGRKIAVATSRGIIEIRDADNGSLLSVLKGHSEWVMDMVFSSDGKKLTSCSMDKTAKVWDVTTGVLLTDMKEHKSWVVSAAFSGDSKMLLTASKDGTAILWKEENAQVVTVFKGHAGEVNMAVFADNEKKVITASADATIRIWNTDSGQLQNILKGLTAKSFGAFFTSDRKKIVTRSADGIARLWDAENWHLLLSFAFHQERINFADYLEDGNKVITYGNDRKLKCWDIKQDKLVYEVNTSKNASPVSAKATHRAVLSPDRKTILTYYAGSREKPKIRAYETETGKWLYDIQDDGQYSINSFSFSADGSLIYSRNIGDTAYKKWEATNGLYKGSADKISFVISNNATAEIQQSEIVIIDRKTASIITKLRHKETEISELLLSPDSSTIITVSGFYKNQICVWNAKTFQLISVSDIPLSISHQFFSFTPDGKNLLIASAFVNSMLLWDIDNKKIKYHLSGHSGGISDFIFLTEKHQLLTISSEIILWDISTGKKLSKIIPLNDADYLNIISDGFYMGTKEGSSSLHYVSSNLQVITFEQLDVKYNRPDKVLEAIGNTDTALINSYKRAYDKRIRKLGIDTTQFSDGYSVPEADFVNRDAFEFEQKMEQLNIRVKGNDSNYELDRFNIWINEVPLFGIKGINIRNRNSNSFDTTISISLSQGENRIESSVTNINGTESYRMPLYLKYTAVKPVNETVHFIGIGINQFSDSNHNLQWCVKDIRDLALKFKEKYGSNIIIDTLFDQNVTFSNVRALKQNLLKTTINDKVIIAYSGHGLLSKQYDYYLSSFGVNFSKPEENGIAYEEIESLLDGIPARKKLLLLDACHSGEVDKEELLVMQTAKPGNKGLIMNRGSEEETTETRTVGLQNSFELMQSLFVNVGKGTGTTIISAAGGVQFAQERNELRNGVFTYSLLEAMNEYKTIRVSDLKKYVGQRVEQLTDGMQKPTTRNELKDFDWNVW